MHEAEAGADIDEVLLQSQVSAGRLHPQCAVCAVINCGAPHMLLTTPGNRCMSTHSFIPVPFSVPDPKQKCSLSDEPTDKRLAETSPLLLAQQKCSAFTKLVHRRKDPNVVAISAPVNPHARHNSSDWVC